MKISIVWSHWSESNIIPIDLEAIVFRKVQVYFTQHIAGLIWLVQASMHCERVQVQVSLLFFHMLMRESEKKIAKCKRELIILG